jgi:hypothetical protein
MQRRLSSAWTFYFKFVFPVLWMSGFGTVIAFFDAFDAFHGRNGELPPPAIKFVFLGAWIAGAVFYFWACRGLKRVRVDAVHLFVSNYLKEVSIPFGAVREVRQNRWVNFRPITIYFRDATDFGDRATFIPKRRAAIRFWRVDPIVDELRRLAGL